MGAGKQIISTKLLIPLFLVSRNRIKIYHSSKVRNYIVKHLRAYLSCIKDNKPDEEEIDEFYSETETDFKKAPSSRIKTYKKQDAEKMTWLLAPNRYNTIKELGYDKRGIQWSRSKCTSYPKKDVKLQNGADFYEISRNYFGKLKNKCNRHKGIFLTDPRTQRPTTRFMISNPVTCWRNKSDPNPTTYFVDIFERPIYPKVNRKDHVPHKFLRYSCVPENIHLQQVRTSSFHPGPGRYELFDDEQSLQVKLSILTQKRLRFRRIHFKLNDLSNQPSNPGRCRHHIFGWGFTRLFRGSKIRSTKQLTKKKTHRSGRQIRMFPSFEYINMITRPERSPLSIREEEDLSRPLNVLRFNCLVKVNIRRQLRDNKKIVFGSGMPRFKDADVPIMRNLPKPPPLVNYPIMNMNSIDIKTKLHSLPERLRGFHRINRVQPFKFQPIPPVKLLLDEKEVHPESEESLEVFAKELNPMDFVKDHFKKTSD